jgi:TolB protein
MDKRQNRWVWLIPFLALLWTLLPCTPGSAPVSTVAPGRTPTLSPTLQPGATPAEPSLWAARALFPGSEPPVEIAIAADPHGGLHIAWVANRWDSSTESLTWNVYYAEKPPGGPASDPQEIFAAPGDSSGVRSLGIAVDDRGSPHLTWRESNAIFYAARGEDGAWSSPATVFTARCLACLLEAAIAVDTDGVVHLVWLDDETVAWSSRRFDGGWSPAVALSTAATPDSASDPTIVADGNGGLHVAWKQGDGQIVYTSRPAGGAWAEPVVVSGPSQSVRKPMMVVDGEDMAHIVWLDRTRSSRRAEFVYAYKPKGGAWSSPVALPGNAASETRASLALVGNADVILAWGDQPIHYITKLAGEAWSASGDIPGSNGAFAFAIAGTLTGDIHVAWGDGGFWLAGESIAEAALPPAIIAEYAPPAGVSEFVVAAGPGERTHPAIDGDAIVWEEQEKADWNIAGYDLATHASLAIATQPGDQRLPAVSEKIVVWEDHRTETPRIYGFDLDTHRKFPVTAKSSPQWEPDISGSVVVFRDWRKTGTCSWGEPGFGMSTLCDWDVWGVDLDEATEFPIEIGAGEQNLPRISGNNVVWAQRAGSAESAIYGYQLDKASLPARVATNIGNYQSAIDGDIVVWVEWRDGLEGIFGHHFLTGAEFPVAIGTGEKDEPDISGNVVVWVDTRNGDADIYGYDLATGEEFAICTAPSDQVAPAIDGNVVVWVDRRHFYPEVYGARLSSISPGQTGRVVPAPTLTPTPTPAPIVTPTSVREGLPIPRLIAPPDGSALDTLVPVLTFDLGVEPVSSEVYWGVSVRSDASEPLDWLSTFDGTVVQYFPGDNLQPGTIYHWRVDVWYVDCSRSDCQASSEEWSFTTSEREAALPAPVLVSPVGGASVARNDVVLQWNGIAGAIEEDICWNLIDGVDCPEPFDRMVPCVSLSHGDSGPLLHDWRLEPGEVETGKTYCWGVRTRDSHAWSAWGTATFRVVP